MGRRPSWILQVTISGPRHSCNRGAALLAIMTVVMIPSFLILRGQIGGAAPSAAH
jgi:hypothetical protein